MAIEHVPFIVDLPIQNCDFLVRYVTLSEGIYICMYVRVYDISCGKANTKNIPTRSRSCWRHADMDGSCFHDRIMSAHSNDP